MCVSSEAEQARELQELVRSECPRAEVLSDVGGDRRSLKESFEDGLRHEMTFTYTYIYIHIYIFI